MSTMNAFFKDEQDGHEVELTIGECKPWKGTRVYFEIWQSDHRTRVAKFYQVLRGKSSDQKREFFVRDGLFAYQLCDPPFRSREHLVAALYELANKIVDANM